MKMLAGHSLRKKHAACDECRSRKLKCSGEPTGCARCVRDGVKCTYSDQKQMGRPRKRTQPASDVLEGTSSSSRNSPNGLPGDFSAETPGTFSQAADASVRGRSVTQHPASAALSPVVVPEGFLEPSHEHSPAPGAAFTFQDPSWPAWSGQHQQQPSGQASLAFLPQGEEVNPSAFAWPGNFSQDWSMSTPNFSPAVSAPGDLEAFAPQSLSPSQQQHQQQQSNAISCTCIASLCDHLARLNEVLKHPPDPRFPLMLAPLRMAVATSHQVIACPSCIGRHMDAYQTLMLLGTILPLISDCYGELLGYIEQETIRSELVGQTKPMRMGEPASHLHTGRPDCPAGNEVELEPRQWKHFARQIVRRDVLGSSPQDSKSLKHAIDSLEERQRFNHVALQGGDAAAVRAAPDSNYTCLRIVHCVREKMNSLDLDS